MSPAHHALRLSPRLHLVETGWLVCFGGDDGLYGGVIVEGNISFCASGADWGWHDDRYVGLELGSHYLTDLLRPRCYEVVVERRVARVGGTTCITHNSVSDITTQRKMREGDGRTLHSHEQLNEGASIPTKAVSTAARNGKAQNNSV
jgi:hypothetical protein